MKITVERIKLAPDHKAAVRAYAEVLLGGVFLVRDLKVIAGERGLFLSMPSRKLTDHCPACGNKNHAKAHYCNECGARLDDDRCPLDENGRAKLHFDTAHPVESEFRQRLESAVFAAYAVAVSEHELRVVNGLLSRVRNREAVA